MSIVLDTNVMSEIRKQDVDARVLGWLRAQDPRQLFVTATTVGELAAGAAVLPQGRRRREIEAWLRELAETKFAGRVLSYDAATAMLYGDFFLRASRHAAGGRCYRTCRSQR